MAGPRPDSRRTQHGPLLRLRLGRCGFLLLHGFVDDVLLILITERRSAHCVDQRANCNENDCKIFHVDHRCAASQKRTMRSAATMVWVRDSPPLKAGLLAW